ncbi:Cell envelope-associated transcriptional attenuator LytR-CpsA-Psr, subfamily F2 [hydrothermal vent metagenome]|uniref:Cell envelope-associated transcriptional attenuator LytR-CpsA-Psr, subfamily F2 n=1 Tax=hydrothermal vent metagenome TaxID=652676 RepID=A0A3B0VNG2_9ZZZZ
MKSNPSRRTPARIRLPLWALIVLGLGVTILLIGSSVWLYKTVQVAASSLESLNPDFANVSSENSVTVQELPAPSSSVELEPSQTDPPPILSSDAFRRWDSKDRVSILLLGIDQRCEEDGPTHSDSIMVLTIDPVGLSAAVLSLPRDLWVEIPDFGVDRINRAMYFGEIYEYPGGGQALAVQTVEMLIGVPINFYVAVNFDAFVEVVDLIGGIDIDVPEAIDDPDYPDQCYGNDPFSIEAGKQQLDGETALKYARTRETFGGDVDRAGRQQAVILAVREQVFALDSLPQLIAQAPQFWQTSQENVRTNMTLDEAIQLAMLVQDIPRDSIQTAVLDFDYVYNETTPDGRQVLVPVRENIRQLRDQLFAPPAIPTPVIENLPALMAAEQARVAVLNGTAEFGLAASTQEYLQSFGINVTDIGNADASTYLTSQIITYGSYPNTSRYLTQLMHVPPLNISSGTNPDGDYDILIIIGNDWRVPSS